MKIKNLLLLAAVASVSMSAFADDLQTGEWATLDDGSPAMIGQATKDHLFVRGDYADMGDMKTYDNVVSFKAGTPQTVWLYLDDDEIYQNEKVQALPPIAYNKAGDLYNEITYCSFQCDLYLPQGIEMVSVEDEDGEEQFYEQGDRLPSTIIFKSGKNANTKVVDGITYDVYTLIVSNMEEYGTHFSAKNASKYKANGALKKDATLMGIFLQNNNQTEVEGRLADIIIANQEFGLRETFTVEPKWEPNDYRFIYCTGGNNETQRFQLYNRVALYGSVSVVEDLAEKTINNVKFYNIAGMESNEPFDGVNIKVTTYNDGTTSTCKVIK